MASTWSNLGINLQGTGDNSGTWGQLTNVNLQDIDYAISGVAAITLTGNTTLSFTTNSSSTTYTNETGRAAILVLSGSLSATTVTVTVPNIQKNYVVVNNSGATTIISSGGSTTVSLGNSTSAYVYSNGSSSIFTAITSNPGGTTNAIQYNNAGALAGSTNFTFDGTNIVSYGNNGVIRLYNTANSFYTGLKVAAGATTTATFTLPSADGTANQVLQTNGSGTLTFGTVSGGAAWQAVVTSSTFNATVKYGYFVNTTANAITCTLPASPSIGDFISFIDYAGTFQTNNFTVARNGNPIQGSATDLTVATQRAGFTLVYVDSTQGWLLQNN